MDTTLFREKLKEDGFNVVVDREMPAGVFVASHSHAFDVHALITAGEIELQRAGETTTYRAGDSFVMAAGVEHCERYGPEGVKYIVGRRHRAD